MTSPEKKTFRINKTKILTALIYAGLLWFIFAVLIMPNLNTVVSVVYQDGAFTTSPFVRLFGSARATQALRNSFILAPALSVTVGIVGIFIVLATEYFDIKGAKILRLGYMTSLIYSGIILVSGYRFMYGANGFLTNILASIFPNFNTGWFQGFWAVLFVMTFATTGNHLIFLRTSIRSVDFQTIEAAKNLGASQFTILRRVVLPVLTPSLLAVTVFTFYIGLNATSAPLLVGGPDFQTINPMILTFSRTVGSRDLAALMALILGLASIVLIMIMAQLEKRGHYLSVSKVKTTMVKQKISNPIANILVHIVAYGLFVVYMAPVVMVTLFSFTDASAIATRTFSIDSLTLENYINVFTRASGYRPIVISIMFSFIAAAVVGLLIILVCRMITKYKGKLSSFVEYAFMIPWLLPSVLIAIGLVMAFNQPRWYMFNTVLTGTMIIMIMAYVIIRIPFTLRITRAAFFSLDDSLEDAAKNLGAKAMYTFFIVLLPIIMPTVLAVFALNFNFLMTDFDTSVFLYHPLQLPLGVHVQILTNQDANADNVALTFVYAVIMMVVSSIVLYVVYGRGTRETKQ
ncbi:MAG: iron ABC transporter permease [Defluviitaleaceae bacterium]|nr:iron ABC transporter permease [Defluviitaleaceae bacterium]